MFEVHGTIDRILSNDSTLKMLLAEYNGLPAIAYNVAPSDMQMPYLVTRIESNPLESNDIVRRMLFSVDIFVDNGDIDTANKIMKQVDKLLDRTRLHHNIGIGIWKDFQMPIPEEDPAIIHINCKYIVRHGDIDSHF